LYSVYHSYIYIVSVILLLGMIGAIILTAESNIQRRVMNIKKPRMKSSNIFSGFFIFADILNVIRFNYYYYKEEYKNKYKLYRGVKNSVKLNIEYPTHITFSGYIPLFILNNNNIHSEDILGTLIYFIISNVFVGLLLLIINSFFSLSVKYLEKGGGFECGFTSFLQTRERYNIIFYRVSLLFLVFDLEIILIFPYPALYQKNQNISKNNVLAFLYILIVGFIYELKEGALNIVKKAHSTEINIKD
jgi:NADH-quinone oxidoreductase subunit A